MTADGDPTLPLLSITPTRILACTSSTSIPITCSSLWRGSTRRRPRPLQSSYVCLRLGPSALTLTPLSSQFETFTWDRIGSTHGVRTDLFPHDLNEVLVTDFFGGVASVDVDQPSPAVTDHADEIATDAPALSRPVVREGLAIGQARKAAEERKLGAARHERSGKWLAWTADAAASSPAFKGSLLVRTGWATAGAVLLGASGWLSRKV